MRFIPRMTTQRWMVAVAVVGIVLGVTIERRKRFRQIADYHRPFFDATLSPANASGRS